MDSLTPKKIAEMEGLLAARNPEPFDAHQLGEAVRWYRKMGYANISLAPHASQDGTLIALLWNSAPDLLAAAKERDRLLSILRRQHELVIAAMDPERHEQYGCWACRALNAEPSSGL